MNNGYSKDDLVLLHGDVLAEHISGLRSILHSDNVFFVVGPKEHLLPGKVQAVIRITEVIDFQNNFSLASLLRTHCNVFDLISEYLRGFGRELDHYGFDILFDYLMNQFTILFVSPVKFFESGLMMLQQDIPDLASSITFGGCIKYYVNDERTKYIVDCKMFKDMYKIDELFK